MYVTAETAEMTSLLSLKDTRRSLEKIGSMRALGHGTRSQYNKQVSVPQQSPIAQSPDSNQQINNGQEAMLDLHVQAVAASNDELVFLCFRSMCFIEQFVSVWSLLIMPR